MCTKEAKGKTHNKINKKPIFRGYKRVVSMKMQITE